MQGDSNVTAVGVAVAQRLSAHAKQVVNLLEKLAVGGEAQDEISPEECAATLSALQQDMSSIAEQYVPLLD